MVVATHAHPERPASIFAEGKIPSARLVILPFSLRGNKPGFDKKNRMTLFQPFPHTKGVCFDGYFLVFLFEVLPPKPWPITIAGVQCYFTTDANDSGPLGPLTRRTSRSLIRIFPDMDARNISLIKIDDVFDRLKTFFREAGIEITEIQYWNDFFCDRVGT